MPSLRILIRNKHCVHLGCDVVRLPAFRMIMQHLIHHLLRLLKVTYPNRPIYLGQRRISDCQRRGLQMLLRAAVTIQLPLGGREKEGDRVPVQRIGAITHSAVTISLRAGNAQPATMPTEPPPIDIQPAPRRDTRRQSGDIGTRMIRRSVASSVSLGRASQASTWKLRAVPHKHHSQKCSQLLVNSR
jgi:hypothetical protein